VDALLLGNEYSGLSVTSAHYIAFAEHKHACPCQIIYHSQRFNWWSWQVRLAHPQTRLEAVTSRPLQLAGVARLTQHAGQFRLLVTLTHAAGDQIKAIVANVRKAWMRFSLLRLSCRNPSDGTPLCATSLKTSSPPNLKHPSSTPIILGLSRHSFELAEEKG